MGNDMKFGDTVYGINQSGMVGEDIIKGILNRTNIAGYYNNSDKSRICHELYVGPEDKSKSDSIFDYRLFEIEEVFATHEEAKKRYFVKTLAGD